MVKHAVWDTNLPGREEGAQITRKWGGAHRRDAGNWVGRAISGNGETPRGRVDTSKCEHRWSVYRKREPGK